MLRIAYFISPHGFGHATRAAAIMAAMQELDPAVRFETFTLVPRWLFQDSLRGPFGYHEVNTDLGLVQRSALRVDIDATLQHLDTLLPFDPAHIATLGQLLQTLGCGLVMCDIAPMGIVVAKQAGLPSILVENFTWDWIYQAFAEEHSAMIAHIRYLRDVFASADYHIQTEPVCVPQSAVLTTHPVSRKPTSSAADVRVRLGIPSDAEVVMLTMGGIPGEYPFVQRLTEQPTVFFIIPGGASEMQKQGNVILLPHHSAFFHPDLIQSADAVVGKAGYSTVAEVYAAGLPFGYIPSKDFPEAIVLANYIDRRMHGIAISETEFFHGHWLARLPELLSLPRLGREGPNGAEQVARFMHKLMSGQILK